MSDYEIHEPRFAKLIIGHAKLERLWTGSRWAEGPVYAPAARHVLWSDIPNNRVLRFVEDDASVSVFEAPCGHQNGHALDAEGRVIACEHGGRRISRLDHDGVWRPLATHFEGKRLNSPNDVIVKSDGSIWFSDPTYGIDGYYEGALAESEIGEALVFRLDPVSGELTAVARDRVRPNGLAFSPDESILYVADTGETHVADTPRAIHAYAVGAGGRALAYKGVFAVCDNGFFDGFRVDIHGNLWTSSADSVRAYAPDGTLLGRVRIPELVSNLCFGGRNRNRLYITAQTSLYAIYLNTHAANWAAA
jgi:gluconolactonase